MTSMLDSREKQNATKNKYGFIYITTNNVNGKRYIGQRKYYGKYEDYLGSGILLAKAIMKYGSENFTREIIEECNTKESLNEREIYWINYFQADTSPDFYNIRCGGLGGIEGGKNSPWYGRHLTDEHKQKLSESKTGEKNPFYGKHHSKETKRKMSLSSPRRKHTEEFKQKISKIMRDNHVDVSGDKNPRARAVDQFDLFHNYIKTFTCIEFAARETGACRATIGMCCSGKYKTAGGYIWEYSKQNELKEAI